MAEAEPSFTERGDVPACTVTWEWGRDEPDGSRIDRYVGADGFFYERIIPKGGGYCPEVQGAVPGLAEHRRERVAVDRQTIG